MKLLQISANPHIREEGNSAGIMRDVVIAMLPTAIYGCLQWGFHSFLVVLLTTLAAVVTEYIYQKAMKLPVTISDWSAAVTGMILALNCPPNIPYWIPMVGSVFAILVVKQLYGGLGANFMNPALAARCFLLISFASQMSSFTGVGPDAVATACCFEIDADRYAGSLRYVYRTDSGNHRRGFQDLSTPWRVISDY